jgi:hypothetical protein
MLVVEVVELVVAVLELERKFVIEEHKLEELKVVVVVVVEVVLGLNNHFCNYIDHYQKLDWQGMLRNLLHHKDIEYTCFDIFLVHTNHRICFCNQTMDGVVFVVVDCKVVEAVEQESMFVVVEQVVVVVELVYMLGVVELELVAVVGELVHILVVGVVVVEQVHMLVVVEQGVVAGVEEVLLVERVVEHSFVELDTVEKHFSAKQELQLLAEFQNSLH